MPPATPPLRSSPRDNHSLVNRIQWLETDLSWCLGISAATNANLIPKMLTPAELRQGSRRARELALNETTSELRLALAAHALALATLAERLEREICEAAHLNGGQIAVKSPITLGASGHAQNETAGRR